MTIVKQLPDGTFDVFTGGVATRMESQAVRRTHYHDGRPDEIETVEVDPYPMDVKVPLKVAEAWTDEELEAHGLFRPEPFVAPEGKRIKPGTAPSYARPVKGGAVVETREVEDTPAPKIDSRTPAQKFEAMASDFGLTPDELRAQLVGPVASK